MEKVQLDVSEYDWYCPNKACLGYNTINANDLWEDGDSINVECSECHTVYRSNTK